MNRVVAMGRAVAIGMVCVVAGCSSAGTRVSGSAPLSPADVDALTGAAWVGTLTYLDYTSQKRTTIDSSLIVRRVGDRSWEFGTGYSKEPHADSKETVVLSADGRVLGDERVVERSEIPSGVVFVTECDGEDDHKAARFRFEHRITAHEYTRRKLVRFAEGELFERHVYEWRR